MPVNLIFNIREVFSLERLSNNGLGLSSDVSNLGECTYEFSEVMTVNHLSVESKSRESLLIDLSMVLEPCFL